MFRRRTWEGRRRVPFVPGKKRGFGLGKHQIIKDGMDGKGGR